MKIITLYKYTREDGGITVSPNKPECEYAELVRIVADEGKRITQDGETLYIVIDQEASDGWYEVDDPQSEQEVTDEHIEQIG